MRLLGQQPDREVDEDKAADTGDCTYREDQPNDQRINIEVFGDTAAHSADFSVHLIEAELLGWRASIGIADIVHTIIPVKVVAVGLAKLLMNSVAEMATAPMAAKIRPVMSFILVIVVSC